jgi:hypothetical protein
MKQPMHVAGQKSGAIGNLGHPKRRLPFEFRKYPADLSNGRGSLTQKMTFPARLMMRLPPLTPVTSPNDELPNWVLGSEN